MRKNVDRVPTHPLTSPQAASEHKTSLRQMAAMRLKSSNAAAVAIDSEDEGLIT
jgi:hypothetical protein